MKRVIRRNIGAAAFGMLAIFGLVGLAQAEVDGVDTSRWEAYLDFAYVYVSADAQSLGARLKQYGSEAGMTLDEYVTLVRAGGRVDYEEMEEAQVKRLAIAQLLQYLATREPQSLEQSVDAISIFDEQQGRHENLFWVHYIHAHRALEKGNSTDFTRSVLKLWIDVVVPLESPYETLQALSLSQSANSGFVSALPYLFENISRMILIRSQEMGIHRDLDPLAAVVRMLATGRLGAHPDVIPADASSKKYLDRIISRLDGPESDGGSLTFTLVLFEAGKYHDEARSLLASQGLSDETVKAIGVTSGAYQMALNQAQTLQGQSAVYIRVLRQLGEVWAAKQRLGVDPYVEQPFTIEGAIRVYRELYQEGRGDDWAHLGFRRTGYESYVLAMRTLWEEIQETSLNAADYYLTRSMEDPARADDHIRSAARTYARYLAFFSQFASEEGAEYVPDSAYFAAYEAAKGYADAFLVYQGINPTAAEIDYAVDRYMLGLQIFPYDRHLWPSLAAALERQGRSNQFLSLVRPLADRVSRSRHLDAWIQAGEPGSKDLAILRRAMSDELAVMYLGFAEGAGVDELEQSLQDLRVRRAEVEKQILALGDDSKNAPPASMAPDGADVPAAGSVVERAERNRKINEAKSLLAKLDKQLAARSRALPLFRATLETDDLIPALRSQRNHPVHTLLRRFYYENRS